MRTGFRTALAAVLIAAAAETAHAQNLRFSGFGDFVFGANGGGKADGAAAERFGQFGSDLDPVNTNRGFGLTGTDFVVLADMTDNATFLGEINLQTGRGGSSDLGLDVERFFVDYKIDPKFNLQTGLYFTPIGYNNRFLYARAWLMNSIQVPDFFEEELNLFPTHSVGAALHGEFALANGHRLAYVASAANGRPHTPDSTVYARDYTANKEVTGLLEWLIPGFKDSRIGVSGWFGNIDTVRVNALGDLVDGAAADTLRLKEHGLDAYVVVHRRHFSINAEWVRTIQRDRVDTDNAYRVSGGLIEVSAHVRDGKMHPYVRFDRTMLPEDGGPYISLRETDAGFTRVYIPETKSAMTGVAYDLNQHMRVKGEYIHHLSGPRDRHGVAGQLAFGF